MCAFNKIINQIEITNYLPKTPPEPARLIAVHFLCCMIMMMTTQVCKAQSDTSAISQQTDKGRTNWSFYLGMGITQPDFDQTSKEEIDRQKDLGAKSPFSGTLELPGVYYSIDPHVRIGTVTQLTATSVARDFREDRSISFYVLSQSLSTVWSARAHESNTPLSDGFILRADVGPARLFKATEDLSGSSEVRIDGLFSQAGVGYVLNAGSGIVYLNQISVFGSWFDARRVSGVVFTIGVML